jgi:hypothetical protein
METWIISSKQSWQDAHHQPNKHSEGPMTPTTTAAISAINTVIAVAVFVIVTHIRQRRINRESGLEEILLKYRHSPAKFPIIRASLKRLVSAIHDWRAARREHRALRLLQRALVLDPNLLLKVGR